MIPATLSFLHTVHIFARPSSFIRPSTTALNARPIEWQFISDMRLRHIEVKLDIAEVAKKQKNSDSFSEYMRHEETFNRLVKREEHFRKKIAKLLTKYFQQQKC